ncbi:C1 family peptidase [Parafilimonas sp.]|uniref:C1 family peptidase n=1 Tax=Parafilimonas sp. TaxID=1969739 RepID=UPI0039E6914A
MKKNYFIFSLIITISVTNAQTKHFTVIKNNAATPVKNQGHSGTCWCYSSTAMTESELLLKKLPEPDLSETYTVYNLYIDKAVKYIRRRGNTRFTEGGLGQDMLNAVASFGAMPQEVYPGIGGDTIMAHNYKMAGRLKNYLDSVLAANPDTIPLNWKDGFVQILNSYLGRPPGEFDYQGKHYTPESFAAAYISEKPSDFIGLTSFTHHPFYTAFAMEVPDNYNSNIYYNLPLDELISTTKACIEKGYTLTWDADISNMGFRQETGIAEWVANAGDSAAFPFFTEPAFTQAARQDLFDRQVTQDDHLMQITGIAKDENGKAYFIVKNSWGEAEPYKGYIYVSIPYFAINTISVIVNKKALPGNALKRLVMN